MSVTAWGLKRLGRYTFFLPSICVSFPEASQCSVAKTRELHPSIQGKVLELQSYSSIQFVDGAGAWAVQGSILHTTYDHPDELEAGVKWSEPGVIWEHEEDILLRDNSVSALSVRRSARK